MNLLYLTFGDNIYTHIQAHFSVYTFLTQGNEVSSVNIITDYPEFYHSLGDYVNLHLVSKERLQEWKGEHNFFWRIKLKALEQTCMQYSNQPVMYVDSDTFLYRNIRHLKQAMQQQALMHEDEGALANKKSKTEQTMWRQIRNKEYGGIRITASHHMWNAGTVATPNKRNGEECALALKMCDEMCSSGVARRLIEQFALSVALHEMYGLRAANDAIAHYWSNKQEWNETIVKFIVPASFKGYKTKEMIEAVRHFEFSSVPVSKEMRNTNLRLKQLADSLLPPRNVQHVKNRLLAPE